MNILNRYIMKKIEIEIKRGAMLQHNNPLAFSQLKKDINQKYGVFYMKYMPISASNELTVIVKRRSWQYVYNYNMLTGALILKGERSSC